MGSTRVRVLPGEFKRFQVCLDFLERIWILGIRSERPRRALEEFGVIWGSLIVAGSIGRIWSSRPKSERKG